MLKIKTFGILRYQFNQLLHTFKRSLYLRFYNHYYVLEEDTNVKSCDTK